MGCFNDNYLQSLFIKDSFVKINVLGKDNWGIEI